MVEAGRVDQKLGAPASDVRTVFSWSYQTLSTDAARLFRLLGLHPGPDFTIPAAASLAGISPGQVQSPLAELARAHLIIEHTPGRYTYHDLLRAYAIDQTHAYDSAEYRHTAQQRILDHYPHSAHTAALQLDPHRDPITLPPPQPGMTPEHLADSGRALAWLTAEHPVLLAVVDQAADTGLDSHTVRFAWTLATFLEYQGHWRDQLGHCRRHLRAELRHRMALVAQVHRQHARDRGDPLLAV
jgi:hypothetical protein